MKNPAFPLTGRILLWLMATMTTAGCAKLHDLQIGKAGADYWFAELRGKVQEGDIPGATIDVQDTLALKDEDIVNLHATAQLGNVTIDASYFDVDYKGNNQLIQTIDFAGEQFMVGTELDSRLKLQYASGKLAFGLIELGPVVVGPLAGVEYFNLDGSLTSSTPPLTAKERLEAPFPVVGAVATVNQPLGDQLSVFAAAELSGIYVDVSNIRGRLLDVNAQVGLQLSVVRIGGGYRFLQADIDDTRENFTWDLSLGGPFVTAEIAF